MEDSSPIERVSYFVEPGYIYVSRQPTVVATVLGSCVAVCLWDRVLKAGGMNHFLYPRATDAAGATPRYGNAATIGLVRMLLSGGSNVEHLEAQIFGGGRAEGTTGDDIGRANVEVARKVLARRGIPILSEDVGGTMGRKIVFDLATGEVFVVKVHRIRKTDWVT